MGQSSAEEDDDTPVAPRVDDRAVLDDAVAFARSLGVADPIRMVVVANAQHIGLARITTICTPLITTEEPITVYVLLADGRRAHAKASIEEEALHDALAALGLIS